MNNLTAPPDDIAEDGPGYAQQALLRPGTRHNRRLSDKVLGAFHQACDVGDLEAARELLRVAELLVHRPRGPSEGNRRRNLESLVAAHERLWWLRHAETAER